MLAETYWHLAAWFENIGASLVDTQINAANDGILTRLNNNYVLPRDAQLLFSAVFGVNMSRAVLNVPSLRYVGLPALNPTNNTLTVPSPVNVNNYTENPILLKRVDEIEIDVTNAAGAAEDMYAFCGFGFGRRPVPPGQMYRLRATAAITNAAGTWVNGSMTLATNLPQGIYSVIGMQCVGANLLAARLIFPGASFRPGCIASENVSRVSNPIFRDGSLGEWGRFENVNLPNLETMSSAANTAQTVYIDLVRLGDVGSVA